MTKLVKIGTKYINIDLIAYIDFDEMTIYLNSYDGLTGVYYDDNDFDDEEEFAKEVELKLALIRQFE
jgi:hypothetical protein